MFKIYLGVIGGTLAKTCPLWISASPGQTPINHRDRVKIKNGLQVQAITQLTVNMKKVIICQAAQKCPCLRRSGYAQAGRCKLSLRNPAYGGSCEPFPAVRQAILRVASRRIRSDTQTRRRVGESARGVLGGTPQQACPVL
jgi:hypothetical protein